MHVTIPTTLAHLTTATARVQNLFPSDPLPAPMLEMDGDRLGVGEESHKMGGAMPGVGGAIGMWVGVGHGVGGVRP